MMRDDQPDLVPSEHARSSTTISTSPVSNATTTAQRLEPQTRVVDQAGPVVAADGTVVPLNVAPAAAVPVASATRRTTVRRAFALDSIVAAAAGVVVLVVGLLAVVRAGLDGSMKEPIVDVAGFTHTAVLGGIEIVVGLGLLIAGAARSRGACAFWGVVLGIAGFVGGVQSESFDEALALESSMAWIAMIVGIVVLAAAMLLPRRTHTSSTVDAI